MSFGAAHGRRGSGARGEVSLKGPRARSAADRDAVFEMLLRRRGLRRPAASEIRPQAPPERAPLSYAQERLWYLDRLDPGSSAYNLTFVIPLAGAFSVPVFERALAAVVRRHAVLRTRFAAEGGEPWQVV